MSSNEPIITCESRLIHGDCLLALDKLPEQSVHLALTSPPFYNARPQYQTYKNYPSYLGVICNSFRKIHRVLAEGRFIAVIVSAILVPRRSRNESSKRLPL